MDMTIGQLLIWVQHHWIQIVVWLIAADNVLITAFDAAGWKDTFLTQFARFLISILTSVKVSTVKKVIPLLLLFPLIGCSSAGMNTSCGHIIANGSYATATGSGAGFLCHQGCIGFNCPKPDYTVLATVSTAYINANNAVTTTVPITVAVVPTAK